MALKQNIIYVYFKGKHLTTSKSQYQYNHGQFLYFADLDLPQAFEVHFSNEDKGYSKPKVGSNKLVEIPDEYFWSGASQIYAWVYLHSDTDDGETIYEVKIPLTKRAKPTDEEPLPQQESAMERAIAELNNAVEITTENANKTEEDKTQVENIRDEVVDLKENIDATAETVAQKSHEAIDASRRSEASAQNAAEFEEGARRYSEDASQYAQEALESKNTAKQKAQVANDASAEAKDFRDEAETFKNEAEQAKQNIVDYRDETKGYRDETLTAKDDVQTIKGDIQSLKTQIDDTADNVFENAREAYHSMISADNASLSASESAENANQSANEANQSATNASESASQAEEFKNQSEEYKTQAEEFKNQTETNVTHYPKIIGEYWYVWDATNGEYINTNVDANGIKGDTGRGIASIALNDDYTLTITFTDDTTYTTSSIRGQQGEKGDTGESGVYIGTEEPENEDIKVWIDTDDDGTSEDLVKSIESLKENIYKPYAVDSTSGSIASFADGADDVPLKSLVVDINPVQDLHGYDSPWVGGAGKNLFNKEEYEYKKYLSQNTGNTNTSTGNPTWDTSGYIKVTPGMTYVTSPWTVTSASEWCFYDADKVFISGKSDKTRTATAPENAAYVRVDFPDTVLDTFQLEEGSTATEYAPYENICPISGWEECEVNATGKNICNATPDNAYTYSSAYNKCIVEDNLVTITGNVLMMFIFHVKPSTEYTFSYKASDIVTMRIYEYTDNPRGFIGSSDPRYIGMRVNSYGTTAYFFTTNEKCHYVGFGLYSTGKTGVTVTNWQVELGSIPTSYEPYQGQSIPISWQTEAGTVYGGKLDVLSGVLTLTNYFCTPDNATRINYGIDSQSNLPFAYLTFPLKASGTGLSAKTLCSMYKAGSAQKVDKALRMWTSEADIWDSDLDVTSLDTVKSYFANLMIVYPLETPIEIQLTPHEVNSLLGINNIWADTGDISVEYFSQVDEDLVDYIKANLNSYAKKDLLNNYVDDVQIDGTSIVSNGIAEIPIGSNNNLGVAKYNSSFGITIVPQTGVVSLVNPTDLEIKNGTSSKGVLITKQHESTFYGLAKVAGVDEKNSELPVGIYTDEAKTAIKQMLGVHDTYDSFVEEITGTDVTITGQPSYRYNCGEVLSLSITPPESGTIDIRFTSGSTPTVLTLPSTVKMPEWWVEVEANTIYEMCITDGIYCGVMTWAM